MNSTNKMVLKGPVYNSNAAYIIFGSVCAVTFIIRILCAAIPWFWDYFVWLLFILIILVLFMGITLVSPTDYIIYGSSKSIYHHYLCFFRKKVCSKDDISSLKIVSEMGIFKLKIYLNTGTSFVLTEENDLFRLRNMAKSAGKLMEISCYDETSQLKIETKESDDRKGFNVTSSSADLLAKALKGRINIEKKEIAGGYLYRVELDKPKLNQDHPSIISACGAAIIIAFPVSIGFIMTSHLFILNHGKILFHSCFLAVIAIPVLSVIKLTSYFFAPKYIEFAIRGDTLTVKPVTGSKFKLAISEIEDITAVRFAKNNSTDSNIYMAISMKDGSIYKIENTDLRTLSASANILKATFNEMV